MRILTTVLLLLISTGFTAVCTPASAGLLSTLSRVFEHPEKFRVPPEIRVPLEKRMDTLKEVGKDSKEGAKELAKEGAKELGKELGKDDDKRH
jgi:hypothetical protein